MKNNNNTKPSHFYVVGLNYKKADAETRGKFSLSDQAKSNLLDEARLEGISSLIAISTCNRTELYGFAEHPFQLISLLCKHSNGTVEDFQRVAYIHKNNEAISHLFKVGTGMDSQILGDFEIISQVKTGFIAAREKGLTNSYFERLVNSVIQASKRIKNETEISTGATSVSFASVHYILHNVKDIKEKNILLFGTGKIGRNTCENLVKHTKNNHITLINRTKDKARKIAGKFNLIVKDYADLQAELQNADVLIVATGAQNPTIDKELLNLKKPLLILDLSIPKNVNENVLDVTDVTLVHLDQLSQMTDDTLAKRKEYVPQAMAIIDEVKYEFITWTQARKFAPTIHALKAKLEEIKETELKYHKKKIENFDEDHANLITTRLIQKITSHFANHLKNENTEVDESIEWIEKVFQIETLTNE
ncbi:glutamyl-tRNA reductase [Paenimyroides baculatum]|uniref:Glutamyl-tRNA reductase n=1 Tax=Paenimyroides baculatum TaxID=2608000 RepID=A0A5M6CVX8_9FLAO|nr:glutamyl-tRNA reductase [Paenimyroides baculatum]KAA5538152.1 glutamyl-tRNA reductase [Paenimyroides baculatum]